MCSRLFIFSNSYQLFIFLFSSSFSSFPSHLHILYNSSLFSLYKNLHLLFLFLTISDSPTLSNFLISLFSLFLSSSPSMAPKAKKSSHVLFANAFRLTHWSRAVRLVGSPPLTYQPKNHIPMGEFVSFSFFFLIFKFLSDLWFECVFCYVNSWVLLWDGFR